MMRCLISCPDTMRRHCLARGPWLGGGVGGGEETLWCGAPNTTTTIDSIIVFFTMAGKDTEETEKDPKTQWRTEKNP